MKKTFLFVLAMIALLSCLFAVSVSAETITNIDGQILDVTIYDDAPARTNIVDSTDDVVVFNDGFCCPSAYVFKDSTYLDQKAKMFDFSFINGKTQKTYTYEMLVEVDIPQGVTSSATYTFAAHGSLRRVSLPNTLVSIGSCFFENVSKLEECIFEHGENSNLETIPDWMFANCTSLKAISFPDCIKYMKGKHQLGGCTNLTAIYLSKNLISTEGGQNGDGTFAKLQNGYFVNTPFNYDNIPSKPDIYYFPANLYTMTGEAFDTSKNLNRILVFQADNIDITNNGYTFEGATCDSNGTKPIIVFTGDVDKLSVGGWNVEAIYFANENDKSASDMTLTGSKKFVFCHGGGAVTHLSGPSTTTDATCTENSATETLCFCGAVVSRVENEGSALGHNFENGVVSYIFGATLYENASSCTACIRNCGAVSEPTDLGVVIEEKGYSSCDIGGIKSFTKGYYVNTDLLAIYEEQNGPVVIGYAFALAENINIDDGVTLSEFQIDMVLKNSEAPLTVNNVDYMIRYKDDSRLDAMVVIAGYYTVGGETVFGSVESVSYSSVAKQGNVTVNPDGSVDGSIDIDNLLGNN